MDTSIQSIGNLAVSNGFAARNLGLAKHSSGDINKTAADFESVFASQMIQPMFESVGVDPVFGGGHGEEVMRSFLVQEYGRMMASTGQIGIASSVKNEMIRAQSATSQPN